MLLRGWVIINGQTEKNRARHFSAEGYGYPYLNQDINYRSLLVCRQHLGAGSSRTVTPRFCFRGCFMELPPMNVFRLRGFTANPV